MPLQKTFMKDLTSYTLSILFFVFTLTISHSQQDNLSQRIKIDGVAAVVGDFIILDSDIDKTLIDLQ